MFYRRTVSLYLTVCLLLTALMFRTVTVGTRLGTDVLASAHTRTVTVGTTRGKIYDRAFSLLVDDTAVLRAAVNPCEGVRDVLESALGTAQADLLIESGTPQVIDVPAVLGGDEIRTFQVPQRCSGPLAAHLIGTLDAAGHGTSGIEKGCDAVLCASSGSLAVRFPVDARGRALAGYDKTVLDQNFDSPAGVVLTLDKTVQSIAEQALADGGIRSGCVLVSDAETGEVLAMASRPVFDRGDLSAALDDEDAPLLNRALLPYAAGSVFKPLVAAFALEHGVPAKTTFTCTGTRTVSGTDFHCYGHTAHGKQTMAQALENSCNCYFIDLLSTLNAGEFLSFCTSFGLGTRTDLGGGITGNAGVLPAEGDLHADAAKANLAFGQGKLLLTPVQVLGCYAVLATGSRSALHVLCGTTDDGVTLKPQVRRVPRRVLSEKTVRTLRALLERAANAAHSNAKDDRLSLAGKTGTAESGVVQNGRAVYRTWFAGFFPADAPRYVIVVLNEDGTSGNRDCAPVFHEIAEKLDSYAVK